MFKRAAAKNRFFFIRCIFFFYRLAVQCRLPLPLKRTASADLGPFPSADINVLLKKLAAKKFLNI